MKKITLFFIAIVLSTSLFGQSEPYIKALKKLKFGTTVLDAAMMMKKDFPQFKPLDNKPTLITVFTNPYDETQSFKIEAFYFVNEPEKEVVMLYYVNDALYEKAALWYLHKDSVEAVEKKYMKCNNTFISNPELLGIEEGKVKFSETKNATGAVTDFPIEKIGKDERAGQTGYKLVYTTETGGKGFWVHMKSFSTMDNGLDVTMNIPHVEAPNVTFEELSKLLVPTTK